MQICMGVAHGYETRRMAIGFVRIKYCGSACKMSPTVSARIFFGHNDCLKEIEYSRIVSISNDQVFVRLAHNSVWYPHYLLSLQDLFQNKYWSSTTFKSYYFKNQSLGNVFLILFTTNIFFIAKFILWICLVSARTKNSPCSLVSVRGLRDLTLKLLALSTVTKRNNRTWFYVANHNHIRD